MGPRWGVSKLWGVQGELQGQGAVCCCVILLRKGGVGERAHLLQLGGTHSLLAALLDLGTGCFIVQDLEGDGWRSALLGRESRGCW